MWNHGCNDNNTFNSSPHQSQMRDRKPRKNRSSRERIIVPTPSIVRCSSKEEKTSNPIDRLRRWRNRPVSKTLADCFLAMALLQIAIIAMTKQTKMTTIPSSIRFLTDKPALYATYAAKPQAVLLSTTGNVERIDLGQYSIGNLTRFDLFTSSTTKSKDGTDKSDNNDEDECVLMYDWQAIFYPTCNGMHEATMSSMQHGGGWLVDSGMVRDVFGIVAWDGSKWALKTLRADRDFNQYHYESNIKDAIVAEQATVSPNVANIYGVCGFSALYEFATDGTLEDHYKEIEDGDRLRVAVQVARGLADVHDLGGGEHVAFMHADMSERQYVKLHGRYLLNDFNTGHMMKWRKDSHKPCKVTKLKFVTNNRAPEEFDSDDIWVDEKIDIYSAGNIYYQLLRKKRKYVYDDEDVYVKKILEGDIPKLPDDLEESNDIVVVALKKAMHMSLALDPKDRPTAKEVADFLEEQLALYEKQQEEEPKDASKSRLRPATKVDE